MDIAQDVIEELVWVPIVEVFLDVAYLGLLNVGVNERESINSSVKLKLGPQKLRELIASIGRA